MLHCQFYHAIGHLTGIIASHSDKYPGKGILVFFHQLAYHTEIQQDYDTIFTHQYIARVRVTVEVSELKYHSEVDIHAFLYYQLGIYVPFFELLHISDLAAFYILHDQDLVRRSVDLTEADRSPSGIYT